MFRFGDVDEYRTSSRRCLQSLRPWGWGSCAQLLDPGPLDRDWVKKHVPRARVRIASSPNDSVPGKVPGCSPVKVNNGLISRGRKNNVTQNTRRVSPFSRTGNPGGDVLEPVTLERLL